MSDSTIDRRAGRALLAVLAFGNFVVGMGAFVVIGIVTPMAEGLQVPPASAGLVLTAYAFAYAILSPVAAALTGTVSRRVVLALGLGLFCLGSVISALSPNLVALCASRIIVALGGAMFTPIAAGVAVAVSTPERRGKALAMVFGGLTLAQVVGTPFGAWIAYRLGWQAAFWTVALLAALAALVMLAAVPRQVSFQATGIGAIIRILRNGRVVFATAFTATFVASLYMVFMFLGPLIEASVGLDPETRTLFLVLYGSGAVIGNAVGGVLTDRIGGRNTLKIICAANILVMPLFSVIPLGWLPFAALVAVWASFSWSFMAPQQARLVQVAPDAIALVLALNAAMIYVGITIGSAASARVLETFGLGSLGLAGGLAVILALLHLLASARPQSGVRQSQSG
jgi:DHA1 family inner membrane transport protein